MANIHLLRYLLKKSYHSLLYQRSRLMLVGEPDEGQCHALSFRNMIRQQVLVLTECLAHLSLHTVAIDSMLETSLGHADEELERGKA